MGKMEVKVERVGRRREVVGKRNADWDELNEKIMGKKNAKKQLAKEKENGEDGWEDEDENVDAGAVGGMKEALNTGASRQEGRMTVDMDGDIEEEIT